MDCAAFVFPAIKGVQAQHEYYVSMVPLEVIAKILQFADEELPPEARAQRTLNKARIPEIRDYILTNPDSYVFSALTVSVDGKMEFEHISDAAPQIGTVNIAMTSRFLINDGQHRRAAIAEAVKLNPALKSEHISVVFYRDAGLQRSQQMFSDLNRYAIKPTKSINILYNSREESSIIAKTVIENVDAFNGLVEKEKSTISNRSKALFTLSAICTATNELLAGMEGSTQQKAELASRFWTVVSSHMAEWNDVRFGRMRSSEVRKDYICSLSITLVAIGCAGNALIASYPDSWEQRLRLLAEINWRKDPQIAPAAMTLSPIRVTHCKIEKNSRGCPTLTVEQPRLYILNGSALYPCARFSVLSFVNSKNLMCIYKKAKFMANKRLNFFNSSPGESKEWFPLQYNFVSIKDIDLFAAKKRVIP